MAATAAAAPPPPPARNPLTISEWRAAQTTRTAGAGTGLARLLALVEAESARASPAWIALASPELIKQQWAVLEDQSKESLPLYGIPFAVKDNIDAAGFVSTAGCPQFSSTVCTEDAPVVARLKAAGAVLVGKTNLDQFATGLNGTRSPHYGAVPNAWDPAYVSGGSSSGSAVVVSRGTVPFSLGTDTAGSGRVPAGLNNIVGLKPTRGALSTRGVLPACRTLDCVSIFALTAEDAGVVLAAAEGYDRQDAYSRRRPSLLSVRPGPSIPATPRIAICANPPWFGQTQQRDAYNACLADVRRRLPGWSLHAVDFAPLFDLARLLYDGPWVAERYQALRNYIEDRGAPGMDPVVRGIVMEATRYSAADAFGAEYARQKLTRRIDEVFGGYDVLLVPTTPTFPSMADMQRAPVAENSRLGTYTNFVNFLDWTALSVPAGFRAGDGLPFGMTLIARTWQEPGLLALAGQWLGGQTRLLGATGETREEPIPKTISQDDANMTDIVVVGAHLTGLPLNKDLVDHGAIFKTSTTTAPAYKLYALAAHGPVPKPGLERVPAGGRAIAVEVWSMPTHCLGSFLTTITHPLGLGRLELADGSWPLGFICEPAGLVDATDITHHGGWKAYLASVASLASRSQQRPLSSVLVANRGEIAVRIIRTLHALGMQAIAIYAAADASSPHVRLADKALPLGPGSVADTYLDGLRIVALAQAAGCDAVIPGYGFLAENADFADAVEAAGMVWVGPTGDQMRQLGLKHTARTIAAAAGVPVVPGTGLLLSVDDAREAARDIGYPVLLKSTAGGGGIGLERCDSEAALVAAFAGVQRLAAANFATSGVFLERYIARAKHVEVQVVGDGTGRVFVAGDRDSSVQRRHQKVVEEAPAPFLPYSVRQRMHAAAADLAARVSYRNVGTVEFVVDVATHEFFFLEVNTRLQVEHPTTEMVTGLDLVECMLLVAGGRADHLFSPGHSITTTGTAIEARLYAESPLQKFRPSSGRLLDVTFPSDMDGIRVDTWIERGLDVSSAYDPLLAKIVAMGPTRAVAIQRLADALAPAHTRIVGVETNAAYLRHVVQSAWFAAGDATTHRLDVLVHEYTEPAAQVIDPGPATTVQDWPGRMGLWHVGVPPSGPMDPYSFRLANQAVGNSPDAPALECTLQGPTLQFYADAVVAVTGATTTVRVDGQTMDSSRPVVVGAGQVLSVGVAEAGYRICVAVRGGFAVPSVLGSRATFELGRLGGHNGRPLREGDILRIGDFEASQHVGNAVIPRIPLPLPSSPWRIGVVPGPHGAPDFFTPDGLALLFASPWTVHYNSNRLGVRLSGRTPPQWARTTGGEAGLHPSNIHDAPYSMGSVSFTGDEAVVVTCDGPSLGGFVVFCVVAEAEMWKLGQARPGDAVEFVPITPAEAIAAAHAVSWSVEQLVTWTPAWVESATPVQIPTPIVGRIAAAGTTTTDITIRQAGDQAVLLEFGDDDVFDLARSFQIHAVVQAHAANPLAKVRQLTPGVRTLHVMYALGTQPATIAATLTQALQSLVVPGRVVSRRLRLPIVFGDEACRRAVRRYASTIRRDAPWLIDNDNVEFLRQLNGLPKGGVEAVVGGAEFLVVGLGDVFLGSPCAVPLDPRHRLFGTKYNPSRSFTPAGAVGIGGQYLCIYAGDSPGGYQLVGRTVAIWDPAKLEYGPSSGWADSGEVDARPWTFDMFDRISFYPVEQDELAKLDSDPRSLIVQDTPDPAAVLDLADYRAWLASIRDDVAAVQASRRRALAIAPLVHAILQPAPPVAADGLSSGMIDKDEDIHLLPPGHGHVIRASVPGRCFKVNVQQGTTVRAGDELLRIESNKMELLIVSPVDGRVASVSVEPGQAVMAGDVLMSIAAAAA